MATVLATILIGVAAGVLSGMFGIGGGIVTTPAIRLILHAPPLVAVGTPLVAIIPSALTGAVAYTRSRLADVRSGVVLGLVGSLTAVLGAWLTRLVGGRTVLILTAALILYTAGDMILQILRPTAGGSTSVPIEELGEEAEAFREAASSARDAADAAEPAADAPAVAADAGCHGTAAPDTTASRPRMPVLVGIGAIAGLYSGFLGLGGGFVIVPLLTRWLRFSMKQAVGTSLFAISVLALPGTVTHALLGNIDWSIAAGLVVGVIPGAMLGARISLGASDRTLRIAFACLLIVVALWLGISEIVGAA